MVRKSHRQLLLAQVVLFGIVAKVEELMDPRLRRIDEVLEDEALLQRVLEVLRGRRPSSARCGRPGTPAEVVLRMLVLKHLRNWSFERLEWEVRGNVGYRRFCRVDAERVPDAKTLVRLGKLVDGATLRAVFERVAKLGVERQIASGRKMRIDTTVVETPIRRPTDSRLLEDSIRVLSRHVRRIARSGVELCRPVRSTVRSVGRRAKEIAEIAKRRAEDVSEKLKKPYRRLLRITGRWVRQAEDAIARGRAAKGSLSGKVQRQVERSAAILETMVGRARKVIRQTRARILRGIADTPDKLISIFEPNSTILRRGKPHKPTEFGVLVKVEEAEHGLITDIGEVPEKADAPLLAPAAKRHVALFGRAPQVVTTDRGFYSSEGEETLRSLGVRTRAIPKPGYKSQERVAVESGQRFRRARAWRAGGEARIAHLKNDFDMARCRYKGPTGVHRSIHWAAIANNLCAIARRGLPP